MPSHSERVRRNYPPGPERLPEQETEPARAEPGRSDEANAEPTDPRRPTPPPKRPERP
jgi:hypothetical protein